MNELGSRLAEGAVRWGDANNAVHIATLRGELAEAERLADAALDVATQTGQQLAPTVYGLQLAAIRREQDRAAELLVASSRWWMTTPASPDFTWGSPACTATLDRPEDAHRLLDPHVADGLANLPWDATWLTASICAADTIAELGWVAGASGAAPTPRPARRPVGVRTRDGFLRTGRSTSRAARCPARDV